MLERKDTHTHTRGLAIDYKFSINETFISSIFIKIYKKKRCTYFNSIK